MVVTTLQQIIDERISFLKEQINQDNQPEVNKTFQLQIDAIRSVDELLDIADDTAMLSIFTSLFFILLFS